MADYSIAKEKPLRYDGGKTLEMIMVDIKEAAIASEDDSLYIILLISAFKN